IVQLAPGGPVERMVTRLTDVASQDATSRLSGPGSDMAARGEVKVSVESAYRGARGLDPELVARIEKMYGVDKPPSERFFTMLTDYVQLDFGESFFCNEKVTTLIANTLPVTISL